MPWRHVKALNYGHSNCNLIHNKLLHSFSAFNPTCHTLIIRALVFSPLWLRSSPTVGVHHMDKRSSIVIYALHVHRLMWSLFMVNMCHCRDSLYKFSRPARMRYKTYIYFPFTVTFSYKGSFKSRAVFVVRPSCTWWLWSLLQSSEEQDHIWCEQREQQSWDKSRPLCCLSTEKLGWYATASNKCQTLNCVSYFNLMKYNCKMRILDRLWCMWFVVVWCCCKLQMVDSDVLYSC